MAAIQITGTAVTGLLAVRHRLRGPSLAIANACASGTTAIISAADQIRLGRADAMLAGGTESSMRGLLSYASFVDAFFGYLFIRFRYKKAGPDEALIIYGRRKLFGAKVRGDDGKVEGFRIVRGGGAFVVPAWEQAEFLSLKMMTLEIDLKHVYTIQGIPINVKAVAQVKVGSDIPHISKAAEGFLGMEPDQIRATLKETVAGHLRGIVGTLTVEELYRDQKSFQEKVRDEAHVDFEGMGFEFNSFVHQEIQDDEGYQHALGQPKIQEALKEARLATAGADRDATLEEEHARQTKEQ
jgi:flotillin